VFNSHTNYEIYFINIPYQLCTNLYLGLKYSSPTSHKEASIGFGLRGAVFSLVFLTFYKFLTIQAHITPKKTNKISRCNKVTKTMHKGSIKRCIRYNHPFLYMTTTIIIPLLIADKKIFV